MHSRARRFEKGLCKFASLGRYLWAGSAFLLSANLVFAPAQSDLQGTCHFLCWSVVALAADGRASQSLPAAVLTGHHLLVAPRPAPRGALCWYRSALTGISADVSADSSIADTTATVAIATVASAAAAVASSAHAHRTRQRQRLR